MYNLYEFRIYIEIGGYYMSENEKMNSIRFIVPAFDSDMLKDMSVDQQPQIGAVIQSQAFGMPKSIEIKDAKDKINKLISQVLDILSEAESSLNNFEMSTVTFSIGLDLEGNLGILGFGGVSATASTGVEITMVNKSLQTSIH